MEEIKAPTLFATHFHELTLLANQENEQTNDKPSVGVANFHVSAHIEPETQKLTMLYKVITFEFYFRICNSAENKRSFQGCFNTQ